jgi:drug/metabolite transporter (DMT)-like permease
MDQDDNPVRGRAADEPAPSLVRTGLLAVVAAAGAALVVHGVFELLGADYLVEPPGQTQSRVGAGLAAAVAALAAAVGAGLTAVIARRSARPERLVLVLVAVGVLLFAANPVLAAEQTLTVVALEVMHLAVAAAFLAVVLPALARRRTGRSAER